MQVCLCSRTRRAETIRLVIMFNSRYIVLEMVDKIDRPEGGAFLEGIAREKKSDALVS